MSEMVERVARALAANDGEADGHPAVMFDYYLEIAGIAVEAMTNELKDRLKQAKAAHSALREVGGYPAGFALGYHDALGELLEYLADTAHSSTDGNTT